MYSIGENFYMLLIYMILIRAKILAHLYILQSYMLNMNNF